jgi:hypothetical protein
MRTRPKKPFAASPASGIMADGSGVCILLVSPGHLLDNDSRIQRVSLTYEVTDLILPTALKRGISQALHLGASSSYFGLWASRNAAFGSTVTSIETFIPLTSFTRHGSEPR